MIRLLVAKVVGPNAQRLAAWSSRVLEAETVRRAETAFPPGTRVRLVPNSCCRATEDPQHLAREWIVDHYVIGGGDYFLKALHCEVGQFPERVFVHASAMRRAAN